MAENREAQFGAVYSDWQRFVPDAARRLSLMDYLLTADAPAAEAVTAASPALVVTSGSPETSNSTTIWPPAPLNDYWPPQRLRDFVVSGYGEDNLDLYWYLYSVMSAYGDRADEFPESDAARQLLNRARGTAARRAVPAGTIPDASIVIPVYNNLIDTLLCVVALLEMPTEHSFEIIVADDGSTDATADLISSLGGTVRYVRQPRNLGFLGNCNAAGLLARGRYLVLLNNDTLVMPHWLDGLLLPFERGGKIGLVGSKLINWDGTLQEAGGIFWADGSAWNFGRGGDARAPEFSYLKDVDYCSGASIAIPLDLWRELDGFDTVFEPAYCEDADIAFRIRKAGYRTLYSPESEVVHHEGRSHGRDLTSGIKAYQVVNQQRLLDRWRDVLQREHFPNAQNVLRARDRSRDKPHVLVIDHYVPQWDQDAGSRTIYQYVKLFLELGFAVTFWPDNLWRDPKYTPKLEMLGVEVKYGVSYRNGFADFMRERADLYDAVFISRPHVAKDYLETIRASSNARILYYGHDLHFRRMQSSQALGNPVLTDDIETMRQLEFDVCRKCDVIFYPDPEEVRLVEKEIGGNRSFINNPVFVYDEAQIAAGRNNIARIATRVGCDLLFVGGFNHSPNREGIVWFVREVMPILRSHLPEVRLNIAGSKPPLDVLDLAADDVAILGFVSDERLAQLYETVALAVAPLRYGAGVKGKVIEAMASGIPIATTPTGAQGIEPAGDMLFVGESAAELAEAILEAINNPDRAAARASRAIEFIQENYSSTALMKLFHRLIVEKSPPLRNR